MDFAPLMGAVALAVSRPAAPQCPWLEANQPRLANPPRPQTCLKINDSDPIDLYMGRYTWQIHPLFTRHGKLLLPKRQDQQLS